MQLDDWVLCRLYNKKNIWEKMQQKKEEALSFSHGETDDSLWEEMGLNNQRTPESEIDNGSFADLDETERIIEYAWQQTGGREDKVCMDGSQKVDRGMMNIKEDTEWFMDMNFDDLQVPNYSAFGSTVAASNQDFFF